MWSLCILITVRYSGTSQNMFRRLRKLRKTFSFLTANGVSHRCLVRRSRLTTELEVEPRTAYFGFFGRVCFVLVQYARTSRGCFRRPLFLVCNVSVRRSREEGFVYWKVQQLASAASSKALEYISSSRGSLCRT